MKRRLSHETEAQALQNNFNGSLSLPDECTVKKFKKENLSGLNNSTEIIDFLMISLDECQNQNARQNLNSILFSQLNSNVLHLSKLLSLSNKKLSAVWRKMEKFDIKTIIDYQYAVSLLLLCILGGSQESINCFEIILSKVFDYTQRNFLTKKQERAKINKQLIWFMNKLCVTEEFRLSNKMELGSLFSLYEKISSTFLHNAARFENSKEVLAVQRSAISLICFLCRDYKVDSLYTLVVQDFVQQISTMSEKSLISPHIEILRDIKVKMYTFFLLEMLRISVVLTKKDACESNHIPTKFLEALECIQGIQHIKMRKKKQNITKAKIAVQELRNFTSQLRSWCGQLVNFLFEEAIGGSKQYLMFLGAFFGDVINLMCYRYFGILEILVEQIVSKACGFLLNRKVFSRNLYGQSTLCVQIIFEVLKKLRYVELFSTVFPRPEQLVSVLKDGVDIKGVVNSEKHKGSYDILSEFFGDINVGQVLSLTEKCLNNAVSLKTVEPNVMLQTIVFDHLSANAATSRIFFTELMLYSVARVEKLKMDVPDSAISSTFFKTYFHITERIKVLFPLYSIKKSSHDSLKDFKQKPLYDSDVFCLYNCILQEEKTGIFAINVKYHLLTVLIKLAQNKATAVRAKVMKSLVAYLQLDNEIALRKDVQSLISYRLLDTSIMVREVCVDLLGGLVTKNDEYFDIYFEKIAQRIDDSGVSVRKRVLSIFKKIISRNSRGLNNVSLRIFVAALLRWNQKDECQSIRLQIQNLFLFQFSCLKTTKLQARFMISLVQEEVDGLQEFLCALVLKKSNTKPISTLSHTQIGSSRCVEATNRLTKVVNLFKRIVKAVEDEYFLVSSMQSVYDEDILDKQLIYVSLLNIMFKTIGKDLILKTYALVPRFQFLCDKLRSEKELHLKSMALIVVLCQFFCSVLDIIYNKPEVTAVLDIFQTFDDEFVLNVGELVWILPSDCINYPVHIIMLMSQTNEKSKNLLVYQRIFRNSYEALKKVSEVDSFADDVLRERTIRCFKVLSLIARHFPFRSLNKSEEVIISIFEISLYYTESFVLSEAYNIPVIQSAIKCLFSTFICCPKLSTRCVEYFAKSLKGESAEVVITVLQGFHNAVQNIKFAVASTDQPDDEDESVSKVDYDQINLQKVIGPQESDFNQLLGVASNLANLIAKLSFFCEGRDKDVGILSIKLLVALANSGFTNPLQYFDIVFASLFNVSTRNFVEPFLVNIHKRLPEVIATKGIDGCILGYVFAEKTENDTWYPHPVDSKGLSRICGVYSKTISRNKNTRRTFLKRYTNKLLMGKRIDIYQYAFLAHNLAVLPYSYVDEVSLVCKILGGYVDRKSDVYLDTLTTNVKCMKAFAKEKKSREGDLLSFEEMSKSLLFGLKLFILKSVKAFIVDAYSVKNYEDMNKNSTLDSKLKNVPEALNFDIQLEGKRSVDSLAKVLKNPECNVTQRTRETVYNTLKNPMIKELYKFVRNSLSVCAVELSQV